jgi:hypothetical protein
MTLLSLPLEILQQIAGYVETLHRPSLYNFSLTSKTCHRSSAFLVFRQISIAADHRDALRRDVDRLLEDLSRMNSTRHVQRITIKGALRLNDKKIDDGRLTPNTNWMRPHGLEEILVDEDPTFYSGQYVVYDEPVIGRSSEEDMAWAPVVSLLQKTIHLKDLVYDCKSQFPPSLLKILHQQHPQCRLHHLTFRFRTLLWGVPYPYEMELATSPSLHRVKLISSDCDTDGDDDFNLEAIMELAAGLAPNLKEVTVLQIIPDVSAMNRRRRGSWKGLPGFKSDAVGSLTSLSLKGYSGLKLPRPIQHWAKYVDFACLQQLSLGGSYQTKSSGLSGETMGWIAHNHSFPRVRTLNVYLDRDDTFHERPNYSEDAVSFFQAFESLEELSIHGPIDSRIMDAILSQHGQTLKKLSVDPYEQTQSFSNGRDLRDIPIEFTKDHVLQIQVHCPVLEDLAIPVKRNNSSASEVEIYRCFCEMRSLRYLFLTLDCSNWRVTRDRTYSPRFDTEDDKVIEDLHPVKRGTLRETFINCAVDETVARAIWNTISQSKKGRQLERLKLWVTGGNEFGAGESLSSHSAIILHLSRSWLIECVPRNDLQDITVSELGQRARQTGERIYDSDARQVFRSIWPSDEYSEDQRDNWSSFPLQV